MAGVGNAVLSGRRKIMHKAQLRRKRERESAHESTSGYTGTMESWNHGDFSMFETRKTGGLKGRETNRVTLGLFKMLNVL